MDIITDLPQPLDTEAELDAIAQRYRAANRVGITVLNVIGGQADDLLEQLPNAVRAGLESATITALSQAMKVAQSSRSLIPDKKGWLNQAVTTAIGAAGGAGGLPTAVAELPVTTTILLRVIQSVAIEHGFDPEAENVQFDCIQVFASAGPLAQDDGADLGFLSARLTITGRAMQTVIAQVAPKLAVVLGQKLAAQAVPVLGAIAGAATNYAYTSYYEDMAHVHFRLRKLAIEADIPHDRLVTQLRQRMDRPAVV